MQENSKLTTVEVTTEIKKELKRICIDNSLKLKELTGAILRKFVKEYEAKPVIMINKVRHDL